MDKDVIMARLERGTLPEIDGPVRDEYADARSGGSARRADSKKKKKADRLTPGALASLTTVIDWTPQPAEERPFDVDEDQWIARLIGRGDENRDVPA